MKKLFVLVVFSSFLGFSQEFCNYKLENVKEWPTPKTFKNQQWYSLSETSFAYALNQTPIGIKKGIEYLESILKANNLDIKNPNVNKNYLSSVVKNIYDYELLNITINDESSQVRMSWYCEKGVISISLEKNNYSITVINLK